MDKFNKQKLYNIIGIGTAIDTTCFIPSAEPKTRTNVLFYFIVINHTFYDVYIITKVCRLLDIHATIQLCATNN